MQFSDYLPGHTVKLLHICPHFKFKNRVFSVTDRRKYSTFVMANLNNRILFLHDDKSTFLALRKMPGLERQLADIYCLTVCAAAARMCRFFLHGKQLAKLCCWLLVLGVFGHGEDKW